MAEELLPVSGWPTSYAMSYAMIRRFFIQRGFVQRFFILGLLVAIPVSVGCDFGTYDRRFNENRQTPAPTDTPAEAPADTPADPSN